MTYNERIWKSIRGKLSEENALLLALSYLSIDVEESVPAVTAVRNGTAAAMRYGLTAFDAAYVDLAGREKLTIATLDTAMRKSAEQAGVTVFK